LWETIKIINGGQERVNIKKDRFGHVVGVINDQELEGVQRNNSFELLKEGEEDRCNDSNQQEGQNNDLLNTKEWVQQAFSTTPNTSIQRKK